MKQRSLLTTKPAAAHLCVSAERLRLHHEGGTGPNYVQLSGRTVRDLVEDLDDCITPKRHQRD